MSKYFKREGSPSYEEMYKAIADIENRLDELEAGAPMGCQVRERKYTQKLEDDARERELAEERGRQSNAIAKLQ